MLKENIFKESTSNISEIVKTLRSFHSTTFTNKSKTNKYTSKKVMTQG